MNIDRIIANTLDDALVEQPWYRQNSNTVVAIASAVVTLGTWLTATLTDAMPAPVAVAVGTVVAVASIIITKKTPNGITARGNEKVERALSSELGHYAVKARESAAEVVDPIQAAVMLGWSEHDPRFVGMTPIAAARAFLANRGI